MQKARLALLWHMHQPPYRDADTGEYLLPWVRLHATRAYNDMAWILERHPEVRCTVNFTPILLEQLDDYVAGRARDRFLELTARPPDELGPDERGAVVRGFFMVDWARNVRPVPRYWELLQKRGQDLRGRDPRRLAAAFTDAELTDLQVHFNLAWMGFGARADDAGVRALAEKGRGFDRADVAYLLEAQRRVLAGIVPRWRRLAERGQIELSTTPYHHPILPLLCDTDAARRALPQLELPPRFAHPEDARWHVREALESHARRFGSRPAGMWPAEGSVSPEAVELLAREGVRWAASDEGVLLRSLPPGAPRLASLYRPWRVAAGEGREVAMLFRDRALSDAIGFDYARVPAREAAADLVGHLAGIARAWAGERLPGRPTVGVFLDGENAWEHYPESGREFLERLHGALAAGGAVETATMSEATAEAGAGIVGRVHSGSWIEASFRVWIGHAEDRRAWAALGQARAALAAAERSGAVDAARREAARAHLHAAEASDWFWWYGDDFATDLAAEFDGLFRGHVVRACLLLGVTPPPEALEPIKRGPSAGEEARGGREPTSLLSPRVDGRETTYFEWAGAGLHLPAQQRGSMYGGAQAFRALRYGFDLDALYLRLDPAESPARSAEAADRLRVLILAGERHATVELPLVPDGAVRPGRRAGAELGEAAFERVLEARLPFAALGLAPGAAVSLRIDVGRGELEVERLPRHGFVRFTVPDASFERAHWTV